MFKVDLHTHSTASPDGGISAEQYATLLENGILDYIAVTDHDSIEFAQQLHKNLGDRIIVGEEINAIEGEIIGLFLKERIAPGLSAFETAQAIHKQGGLVYIPHPFETVRSGISPTALEHIVDMVDIIEVYNARAVMQNRGPQAVTWARVNSRPGAASSDAHGLKGVGSAYTSIKIEPTVDTLAPSIATGHLHMVRPPLKTLLYPKANRLLKKLRRK